jgi:DnaD/phage-associated family protein
MSKKREYYDALDDLLDRPIAFNPAFKKITGRTSAAVWLSQVYYWSKRTNDPDGWFWKTAKECQEETGLTDNEQKTAREICAKLGVVEEKLKGVPATLYYRLIKTRMYELLGVQFPTEQETEIPAEQETTSPSSRKQDSSTVGNIKRNAEITTEITTEIDSDAEIFTALSELTGGGLNSNTPKFVDAWKERHTNDWILKAIDIAKEKRARSMKYVDEILVTWEASGYPKTREERVAEKRTNGNGARSDQKQLDRKAIIRKVAQDAASR